MAIPFSGEQWTIGHGDHEVTVVEVGGGIRTYTYRGVDVVAGYGEAEECAAGRGQLLMPWPNRIRDGRFAFESRTFQLPLSEPGRANASHGLVRWHSWSLADRARDRLVVTTRLMPQQGWAWFFDIEVEYRLDDSGLTVTPRVSNIGTTTAPFGFGAHPYLTLGEDIVDELHIAVPAATRLEVDPERLLPVGRRPVEGSDYDLRTRQLLGPRCLDTAYTDIEATQGEALARSASGGGGAQATTWRVRLELEQQRRRVDLWADASKYRWLQVFTGDTLPARLARRSGVAVEPMTCPPDAFNSGDDLIVLRPGEQWSADWGITPDFDFG